MLLLNGLREWMTIRAGCDERFSTDSQRLEFIGAQMGERCPRPREQAHNVRRL